jgi:hypothetical protein
VHPAAQQASVSPPSLVTATADTPLHPSYLQAPHAFQISMPPQAQIPTESPLEKVPNIGELLDMPNLSIPTKLSLLLLLFFYLFIFFLFLCQIFASGNLISPKSILQSVPPPEFSSVSPDKQRHSDSARRTQRLSTGSGKSTPK